MNLQQLMEKGGFVDTAPIKHPVTWTRKGPDGKNITDKFDVWIVKQSFGTVERIISSTDERSKSAQMLSQCVLLGEEKEVLSYENAYQLDPGLAFVLVAAVKEAGAPKT